MTRFLNKIFMVPISIFVVISIVTLTFWHFSLSYVAKNQYAQNIMATESLTKVINEDLSSRKEALQRIASRWKMREGGTPYDEWSQDALNVIKDEPGYQSIEWVDPNYRVKWIVPFKGNEAALNLDVQSEGESSHAIQMALDEDKVSMTHILTLKTGNKGFLLFAPIRDKSTFHGIIVGVIDAKSYFNEIFHEAVPEYNISIKANNQLVYTRNPNQPLISSQQSNTTVLKDLGWSVTTWASPTLLEKYSSWLPISILCIGLLTAILLSINAYFVQIAKVNGRRAEQEIERRKKTENQLIVYSEKLKKLSLLDDLTKTDNRRSLTRILDLRINQMRDHKIPFSVILLDIDHFKKINDTYGHVIGDLVLEKVGAVLRKCIRDSDTVARYGGEEFCIVLPNATDLDAHAIAERLRVILADTPFHTQTNETFHITCSFGIYQVPSSLKKINDIFKAVDSALYRAKDMGRNCTVVEQNSP